jgi:hypothetical protein
MIASLVSLIGAVRSHWRAALLLVIAAYTGLLHLRLAEEKAHGAKLQVRLGEASALIERERADVRARTAAAQAQDAVHFARVERDQAIVSKETASDYHKQIAALRAAAQRLRAASPSTGASGGGGTDMPGLSDSATGADGAAGKDRLPADDALIASEIAVRLMALQAWVSRQHAASRGDSNRSSD